MSRSVFIALNLLLLCPPTLADQIYKRVDENGKVTYSNTPLKGGQKVELPPLSTVSLPKASPEKTGETTEAKTANTTAKNQRKKELQEAIAQETRALEEARIKAKEGDTPEYSRTTKTVKGKDGKPTTLTEIRDDPAAYAAKMKKLNGAVTAHEKQLAELKAELNRLESKP